MHRLVVDDMNLSHTINNNPIAIYENIDGSVKVDVKVLDENVWLSQAQMADIFDKDRTVITKHINNILDDGELDNSVCANFAHTASDGKNYTTKYYNLDMIISVGYRVNSKRGVQFRKWASNVLKEYLLAGYSLNKEKLIDSKIKELQSAIDLISKTMVSNELLTATGAGFIEIIKPILKLGICLSNMTKIV